MAGRFIDKLVKAARLDPVKKEITLDNGEEVVMYVTPLTAAERERAKKDARSDDPGAFALQPRTATTSLCLTKAISPLLKTKSAILTFRS